jgi:cell division protein FtsW (lipid II flippase)
MWLYLLMVGLLLMVPFFGVVGDAGARRWSNIGILIQPLRVWKAHHHYHAGVPLERHLYQVGQLSYCVAFPFACGSAH